MCLTIIPFHVRLPGDWGRRKPHFKTLKTHKTLHIIFAKNLLVGHESIYDPILNYIIFNHFAFWPPLTQKTAHNTRLVTQWFPLRHWCLMLIQNNTQNSLHLFAFPLVCSNWNQHDDRRSEVRVKGRNMWHSSPWVPHQPKEAGLIRKLKKSTFLEFLFYFCSF